MSRRIETCNCCERVPDHPVVDAIFERVKPYDSLSGARAVTSTPKYTHQDIVNFVHNDEPPEDLTCSVSLGLMRQPVSINGDTADRPYDARVARRALELNLTNPFTRAPVDKYPALVPDELRQKDV